MIWSWRGWLSMPDLSAESWPSPARREPACLPIARAWGRRALDCHRLFLPMGRSLPPSVMSLKEPSLAALRRAMMELLL